jgi:hypothetical protein
MFFFVKYLNNNVFLFAYGCSVIEIVDAIWYQHPTSKTVPVFSTFNHNIKSLVDNIPDVGPDVSILLNKLKGLKG